VNSIIVTSEVAHNEFAESKVNFFSQADSGDGHDVAQWNFFFQKR
jgi:hypothetical protein